MRSASSVENIEMISILKVLGGIGGVEVAPSIIELLLGPGRWLQNGRNP